MNVLIIVAIIFGGVLFALAFFTKRRFGVLGLALTAGATLSGLWANELTPYVQQAGLELVAPPLETVVAAGLILLPATALLFSGPTVHKFPQKVVGAALFALLALAFMLEPLGNALVLEGDGKTAFGYLTDYRGWIITAGILYALFDLLFVKTLKHDKEHH
ncbi:hypothetical protein A2707_03135 [Candidatus Saccharibacteria bacterium RIFCSPHIGHO2_01_FULL_45_15]|nr:MAG: hypothetical protein A2707_03135 [Candidatus Saccharibacteria bacterium RIFCSPHIGHO2_01_FULL_45_15]OGL28468.1 MAG: hypothetical protein A3C39_02925 [Candidatus Saccharibacteria bacterium RIFCSPHIGHO2_02_FULL_46_12]OGL32505.1 MAG: hypothetical protein A3E76_00435 [Candidatus Saccharibacteria bacterium RIFCSPHIGHO2_12_FULL_44_22]